MQKELTKKQQDILATLEEHKSHLTTTKKWDCYAKEHGLPSSVLLIYHFQKWNALKELLHLKPTKKFYNKETLLNIAKEHIAQFTSQRKWDVYAKKNGLPTSDIYIKAFDTWNKAKEQLDLPPSPYVAPLEYTKEEISMIVREHGVYMETRHKWDEYVKGKKLPTYKTLKKHFEWEELLELAGKKGSNKYTREELIAIADKHYEVFASASKSIWTDYARKHSLPSTQTYHREFGSWKKAKIAIIKARQ